MLQCQGNHPELYLRNNVADVLGGAVAAFERAFMEVQATKFLRNKALYNGGAVYARASTVQEQGSLFEGNEASQNGGAMAAVDKANLMLQSATFQHNKAGVSGGALVVGLGAFAHIRQPPGGCLIAL